MSEPPEALPSDLVERVLTKLDFNGRPEPTFEGLSAVFGAWCRNIPFDNVRKLIHVRSGDRDHCPGDDAVDFFEAWLKHGTGGTCWVTNGGLFRLLHSLGFEAARGEATMMIAPTSPRTMAPSWFTSTASATLSTARFSRLSRCGWTSAP